MRFTIYRSSRKPLAIAGASPIPGLDGRYSIEIETIEQLLALERKFGTGLIVKADPPIVEVYDDYIE